MTAIGSRELATAIEPMLAKVSADLDRARALARAATGKLFETFEGLRAHLDHERAMYAEAIAAITGGAGDAGMVGVLREVLTQFVSDVTRIGQASVTIMLEIENLRAHADDVTARSGRIQSIAHTTRVISLNSRIEAHRLGSVGAVFRVVADEIKTLANESREVSQGIRDAIAKQSAALGATTAAVEALSAVDLDVAVSSSRRLEATIARLEAVGETSGRALAQIQADVVAAIQALQFEDMLDQLLGGIRGKLDAVRGICEESRTGDVAGFHARIAAATHEVTRDVVTQHDVAAGSVELF